MLAVIAFYNNNICQGNPKRNKVENWEYTNNLNKDMRTIF